MLPLLREAPAARIVNVSSGAGSLTMHSDPAFAYRSGFRPLYHASKTALNAMTLATAIELESEGIKVNVASPGPTKTNLNNYAGTETVEDGAREAEQIQRRNSTASLESAALLRWHAPARTFGFAADPSLKEAW